MNPDEKKFDLVEELEEEQSFGEEPTNEDNPPDVIIENQK